MTQTSLPLFISSEPESSNVEFKTSSGGRLPKDIWKTISAYSNSEGGKIIFGVTPDGDKINLTNSEIDSLQADFANICNQFFNVEVTPEIQYKNGVLVMFVAPLTAQLRPLYAKSKGMNMGSYLRIGSSNILMDDETIRRFNIAARGGAESITYPDVDYKNVFDDKIINDYIDLLNSKKGDVYQSFSKEEILIKLKAIDNNKNITLFGLLAFGSPLSPQEIIAPTVNITVTLYPGHTKVNEDDLSETYLDNREFVGNVKAQFEQAFRYIKTTLPVRGTIDNNGKRRDYLVIPEVALRESLANAIAHRDYSTNGSSIQIDIYSDRLEIINPGNSLVPIEKLDSAPSTTRNPLLMNYLKDYGITDQKARGVRTITISLKKAGLLEPTFENTGSSFKVILSASAFISYEDKVWLGRFTEYKLNERQLTALAHIKNGSDGISNREYRDINSMINVRDDKRANKELRALVDKDILLIVGENRARRYVINQRYL